MLGKAQSKGMIAQDDAEDLWLWDPLWNTSIILAGLSSVPGIHGYSEGSFQNKQINLRLFIFLMFLRGLKGALWEEREVVVSFNRDVCAIP